MKRIRDTLFLSQAVGVVALTWALSFYLVRAADPSSLNRMALGDISMVLFGTAAVGLFLFTALVIVLAVVGWQWLYSAVRSSVAEIMEQRIAQLEAEVKGRQSTVLGYMIGEMSLHRGSLEPKDNENLALAVKHCEEGYHLLKKVGGNLEFLGLNSLVYFTCALGDHSKRDFLLDKARALKRFGQEHSVIEYLLTSSRVALELSYDPAEKREAREILKHLLLQNTLSDRERRKAELYLASFQDSTEQKIGGG